MNVGRKGQGSDARYVAVLIILIAFFMILYILFVPPEEREVLLNQDLGTGTGIGAASSSAQVEILAASPGTISPERDTIQEHSMNAVNLFVKTEPKLLHLAQSMVVRTSLFSHQAPILTFAFEETDMKKVSLFFSVEGTPRGDLTASINGNVFFSGKVESGARVIEIPLSLVKETNQLELRASNPGLAFWSSNEYRLNNVGIKTDFERINAQESRTFVLVEREAKNVAAAKLAYFQVCNAKLPGQFTNLKIYVNDASVFSGFVRCVSTKQELEFDKGLLVEGKNTVRFVLEQGDFSLNEVKVITETTEADFPTYSFIMDADHMKKISAGKKVMLNVIFASDREAKNARVFIGDKSFIMNTEAGTFSRDVSTFVREGTNFVRIIPSNTFNIVSLKLIIQ